MRPAEEYRTPTDAEWERFIGDFERHKVSLGTRGRSYTTSGIRDHSCVRCQLLRLDPALRSRLVDVSDNLIVRIADAHEQGWPGEVSGLQVSLAGDRAKLAHLDQTSASSVDLDLPTARRS